VRGIGFAVDLYGNGMITVVMNSYVCEKHLLYVRYRDESIFDMRAFFGIMGLG
jgi:hypothetical protein